jgi:hypothetical protein
MTEGLRGGSWNNNERNARLDARNNDHPNNQWNDNGFRVAVPTVFLLASSMSRLRSGIAAKLSGHCPG